MHVTEIKEISVLLKRSYYSRSVVRPLGQGPHAEIDDFVAKGRLV